MDIRRVNFDPYVFIRTDLIFRIYVNDVLITRTPLIINRFILAITKRFRFKDLGKPRLILGLEIDYLDDSSLRLY